MAGITWAQLAMGAPIIFVSLVGSFILAPLSHYFKFRVMRLPPVLANEPF